MRATCDELVARLVDELRARHRERGFGAAQRVEAVFVVLMDRADAFGLLLSNEPRQRIADLLFVRRQERDRQRMRGLVDAARRRHRHDVGDAALELHRRRRQVVRAAEVADHCEDAVLLHELLRREQRALRVVRRILDLKFQLAAMHATLGVGLVGAHLQAVADVLAVAGDRSRQVLDGAQRDLGRGDALGRGLREGARVGGSDRAHGERSDQTWSGHRGFLRA
jgi:hypothetical protein